MKNSLVSLEMSLQWQGVHARHQSRQYFSKANLWRDIFPAAMIDVFSEVKEGAEAQRTIAAGGLLEPYDPKQVITIQASQFNREPRPGINITPRLGRFYPRNLVRDNRDITAEDTRPMRIIAIDDNTLSIDLNNPLSIYQVAASARIDKVQATAQEHGGRCNDFAYEMLKSGAGLQTAMPYGETDFFSGEPFTRADEENDVQFYTRSRLVQHLDSGARRHIESCYMSHLQPGMQVLDLMSSWVSHLPLQAEISVTGLGLNEQELQQNPRLDQYVVHDLNESPTLPFESNAFELVICTASVEYLVKPFEVFAEIARCLKPGGKLLVTFSDRWFPPKAIAVWSELHPFERVALVVDYFRRGGLYENIETLSILHYPRPQDDKYSDRLAYSDPVFVVLGSVCHDESVSVLNWGIWP